MTLCCARLKECANKSFERKQPLLGDDVVEDDDDEANMDGDAPAVTIDFSPPSANGVDSDGVGSGGVGVFRDDASEPRLEQLEVLRRRQQEQMQTLLVRQTEIAERHAQLLSQHESRTVELERERGRLERMQQEQLDQTEIVLEQQRNYLHSDAPYAAELTGCGGASSVHQCGGGGATGSSPRLSCFSAEA